MIDDTMCKLHRHGQGQRESESQAIGRSRGGVTSKILVISDALGNMVDFEWLAGQRHDTVGMADLIESWTLDGLIADKAFDAGEITEEMDQRGAEIVISRHPRPNGATGHRQRSLQMAPSGRELHWKAQEI